MRVLCIDASNSRSAHESCDLIEGEVYIALREVIVVDVYGNEEPGYIIEGTNQEFGYPKTRFILISDINEIEPLNKELELINK